MDLHRLDILRRTDPEAALKEAAALADSMDPVEDAQLLAVCGSAYRQLGQFKKAQSCLLHAFRLAKREELGAIIQRLSFLVLDRRDFVVAERLTVVARRHFLELGQVEGFAETFVDEAVIYQYRASFQKALKVVDRARRFDQFLSTGHKLGSCHVAGDSFTQLREFRKAEEELEEGRMLSEQLNSMAVLKTRWLKGRLELARKNYGEAMALLSEVSVAFERISPCDHLLALTDLSMAGVGSRNLPLVSESMRKCLRLFRDRPEFASNAALAVAARDILSAAETGRRIQRSMVSRFRTAVEHHLGEMVLNT